MANKRKNYTDDEKTQALSVLVHNGMNYTRASNELGIDHKTLRSWYAQHEAKPNEIVQRVMDKSTDAFVDESARIITAGHTILRNNLERMANDGDKLSPRELKEITTVLGITIDKKRLHEGQVTKRTEVEQIGSINTAELIQAWSAGMSDAVRDARERSDTVLELEELKELEAKKEEDLHIIDVDPWE
jgi:transposase-like protein